MKNLNIFNVFHSGIFYIKTILLVMLIFTITIFFLVSCAFIQKQQSEQIAEQVEVSYEKDVYPFIVEQINNTASTFFYDGKRAINILKNDGILVYDNYESSENTIIGSNEIAGICQDYAYHFIDNYKGPGDVFIVSFYKGKTLLEKRIKLFEKSDIKIHDIVSIDSFVNDLYQQVIYWENLEGFSLEWENEVCESFYFIVKNKEIYYSETPIDSDTPLVLFKKEHIKIDKEKYQAKRNREKEERVNKIYNNISNEYKDTNTFMHLIISYPNIEDINIYVKDGKIYLVEENVIQTLEYHVGKKREELNSHAWVRIIWNEMTIDVDPTWYDNGIPLEEVIEVK